MSSSPPPEPRRRAIRRWAPWLAVLSVLLAGAMPWLVCPRLEAWRAEARAEEALAALEGCLLGSQGDPSDALLRARVIAEELARAEGDERWPARCQIHAAELAFAVGLLRKSQPGLCEEGRCCPGDAACGNLARLDSLLGQTRAAVERASFQDGVVAATLEQARVSGLQWVARAGPPAPRPATPRRAAAVAALWPQRHDASALAATADGRWTLLLHQRDRRIGLCTVNAERARADCLTPPAALPLGDVVLLVDGSAGAPAHLLVRHRAQPAGISWDLYRASDGAHVLGPVAEPMGAAVNAAGDGAVLAPSRSGSSSDYVLRRSHGGQELDPVELELGAALGPPLLYGEQLFWVERREDGAWLMARALSSPEPAAAVASLDGWLPSELSLHACRGERQLALLLVAEPASAGGGAAIALSLGGRWSLRPVTLDSAAYGFTCEREGASLTWIARDGAEAIAPARSGDPPAIRGQHRVVRLRCDPGGCARAEAPVVLERHHRGSRYLVGSLDEAVVLLWRSRLGDVRMKLGPLEDLADLPTVSLLDDEAHGGFDWEGAGVDLLARDGSGLLLLHASEPATGATFAFAIDGSRGARPLTLGR